MDKKTVVILALLVLVAITGIGWLSAAWKPAQNIPYDKTYEWTEIFRGYEAYLDRRIYHAVMQTTSMAPTINPGDSVLWVEVENMAELTVGDIIIYKHPTRPWAENVCHRIIEVGSGDRGGQFKTRGDNSPEEHWVPSANIHGLVIGVVYAARG